MGIWRYRGGVRGICLGFHGDLEVSGWGPGDMFGFSWGFGGIGVGSGGYVWVFMGIWMYRGGVRGICLGFHGDLDVSGWGPGDMFGFSWGFGCIGVGSGGYVWVFMGIWMYRGGVRGICL